MKYFLIAGEASADLHGANLVEALARLDSEAQFVGLGGDKMQHAGVQLLQHYREMAYMGVVAVLKNLRKVQRNFRIAKDGLLREQPDRLILIDYPSFNLKMAKFCRKHLPKTKIYYYIPPKVWAWKSYRVHQIARLCDGILAIFPFEVDFYARYGYQAIYVGNPTVNEVQAWLKTAQSTPPFAGKGTIALLPGSRRHEIEKCLPKMLHAAAQFTDYQIVIAAAPAIENELYERILAQEKVQATVQTSSFALLHTARAAIVNSGTATLEAALLNCPQVAVYHVAAGRLLALLRPIMFKIPHFTLVNILANKEVIKELIAYLFTEENITHELARLLADEPYRQQMLDQYAQIKAALGSQTASQNAANILYDIS